MLVMLLVWAQIYLVHMFATILATMVLGKEVLVGSLNKNLDFINVVKGGEESLNFILLPMIIAGLGLIFSIVGAAFVKIKSEKVLFSRP